MGFFSNLFGSGGESEDTTRLFFVTDLHGSDACFKKFCNAHKFYDVDVLILGGDMTGKMIVPIIDQGNGQYKSEHAGKTVQFSSSEEKDKFRQQLRDQGFYPEEMSQGQFDEIKGDDEHIQEIFKESMSERLREWEDFARKKLKDTGMKIYCAPGNDDEFFIDDILEESDVFELIEGEKVELPQGHEMVTTGWTNFSPWDTPRECSEERLREILEDELVPKIDEMSTAIFNIHPPPHNTTLDECPELDEDLQVVTEAGQPVMDHVGSTSVRDVIEQYQPLLSLHGHIHEGKGTHKLGRTMCINPGSQYTEGTLQGCIITLNGEEVKDYQFVNG